MKTPPWVKVYRHQSARFRAMSLPARSMHHLLLAETDESGAIYIGNLEPVAAVQRLLSNDRSDRRYVAKAIGELMENGYLEHDGDRLMFPSFSNRQGTNEPPRRREKVPTDQPSGHDDATTVPRPCHELSDKPAESLKTGFVDKDKEEDKEIPPTPQGADEEVGTLEDQILAKCQLRPIPVIGWRILELASELVTDERGFPIIQPGQMSQRDRGRVEAMLKAAAPLAAQANRTVLWVLADEWIALAKLIRAEECPKPTAVIPYFAKRFGTLRRSAIDAEVIDRPRPRLVRVEEGAA